MITRTDAYYEIGRTSANTDARNERAQNSQRDESVSFKKLLQDRFERGSGTHAATATYSRAQAGGNSHRTQTDIEHLHALKSSNNNNVASTSTNDVREPQSPADMAGNMLEYFTTEEYIWLTQLKKEMSIESGGTHITKNLEGVEEFMFAMYQLKKEGMTVDDIKAMIKYPPTMVMRGGADQYVSRETEAEHDFARARMVNLDDVLNGRVNKEINTNADDHNTIQTGGYRFDNNYYNIPAHLFDEGSDAVNEYVRDLLRSTEPSAMRQLAGEYLKAMDAGDNEKANSLRTRFKAEFKNSADATTASATSSAQSAAATTSVDTNTNVVINDVSETTETIAPKFNPPAKSAHGITEFLNTHLGLNINQPAVMGTPGFTEISYVGKRNLTEFYDGITNIANALMDAANKGESIKINSNKTLSPEEAREIAALLQETVEELKTELENTKIIGGRRLKHPDASEEADSMVIRLWKDFYARHREPTGITESGTVQDMLADLIDSLNLYKHNVSTEAFNEFNEKIERAIEQGLIS